MNNRNYVTGILVVALVVLVGALVYAWTSMYEFQMRCMSLEENNANLRARIQEGEDYGSAAKRMNEYLQAKTQCLYTPILRAIREHPSASGMPYAKYYNIGEYGEEITLINSENNDYMEDYRDWLVDEELYSTLEEIKNGSLDVLFGLDGHVVFDKDRWKVDDPWSDGESAPQADPDGRADSSTIMQKYERALKGEDDAAKISAMEHLLEAHAPVDGGYEDAVHIRYYRLARYQLLLLYAKKQDERKALAALDWLIETDGDIQ